ncbi:hypothetical protein [Alicyclobacillus sp.]|uniref:hypothetical protein n=1 Tax=Alicyclobacillus sp. TaxID=61169 RepID=UPI0025BBC28E|nr:hypothetical protein [Alicyclobacillus sp.]MCL6517713.1 hypothetical protein [Alicyclobacillus sp.]
MGRIGFGYGSEWHLLRYLGRHRTRLNALIMEAAGWAPGSSIEWLDFRFGKPQRMLDAEWTGLQFLDKNQYPEIHLAWQRTWPQRGQDMNWDAIAWVHTTGGGRPTLLLVEGKSHPEELTGSSCRATEPSLSKIQAALDWTKARLGVVPEKVWTKKYYQFANRLFVREFLGDFGCFNVLLVNLYFLGDALPWDVRGCPQTREEWYGHLDHMREHLGITEEALSGKVLDVFVPVDGKF